MIGSHAMTREDYRFSGGAAGAIAAFNTGAEAWRDALISADEAALDMVDRSTSPDSSDPDVPFIEIVWWVNQELLHHGAEIALLRELFRARRG
jgi:hypothetical protein